MAKGTCIVNECSAPQHCKGFCAPHYKRLWRTGALEIPPKCEWPTCAAADCERLTKFRSQNLCRLHLNRLAKFGSLDRPARKAEQIHWAASNPAWRGDEATYEAVHTRIRRRRGPARDHDCVDCGKRARQWSFDHEGTGHLIDERRSAAFSTDVDRYQPRCVPCHKRFDLTRK